jgi:predicted nucleic acid-binding protein
MPANVVFLDTNGWLALINASDQLHQPADAVWRDYFNRGTRSGMEQFCAGFIVWAAADARFRDQPNSVVQVSFAKLNQGLRQ